MHTDEKFVPEFEAEQIRELYRMLQLGVPKLTGPKGEEMPLPASVYGILKEVARNMQMGRVVTVVPKKEEMTTQAAAELLGCSRPHLIKLLERGDLPFQKVGAHRRVRHRDLIAYRDRRDAERHEALNELARDAVRLGIYVGIPLEEGQSDL